MPTFTAQLGFVLNACYDDIEAADEDEAGQVAMDRLREEFPDMYSEADIVLDGIRENDED